MRKIFLLITSLFLLTFLGAIALAQETELPDPGLTPDSPFYFFDTLTEKIGMFFAFGDEKKAKKALKYAEEKLSEAKIMAEKNKTKALEKANERYLKFLDTANQKTEEAKEKGKDVEELATLITEKTLKHQEVLIEVLEKVPEQAKKGIENAIELSRKGSETAVQAVTGAQKEELQKKAVEIRTKNWSVYQNEEYGFEIKYPKEKDWRVMEIKPTDQDWKSEILIASSQYSFALEIFEDKSSLNDHGHLWSFIEKFYGTDRNHLPLDNVETKEFYIDSKPSIEVSYTERAEDPRLAVPAIIVITSNKGFLYRISYAVNSYGSQILSTFKFIELEKAEEEAPKIEEVPKIEEKPTAPNTPMMLDIDVSTTAGIPYTIGWKAVEEATNYILERDTNSSFSNPIIVSSRTLNSFSETLSPSVSTRYFFRVKACNNSGCSSWSKTTELWVEEEVCSIPQTPKILTEPGISVNNNEPYTLNWTSVEGATGYWYQSGYGAPVFDAPAVYTKLNSITQTPHLGTSVTFYYRVKACNDCGCSAWSNIVDIQVIVAPFIRITSPNGGERWVVGQTYNIEWQSYRLEKVTIDLFAYNAEGQVIKGFQYFIAESVDATKLYYKWTVPEIANYPNYKLRIYNKLCIGGDDLLAECLKDRYFDESDNYFSIISSTVWGALSACEKIRKTSDIEMRPWCVAMVKKDSFGCEILSNPETYCYKDVAMVTQDAAICKKIKDPGRRGACEALAERVPAKCGGWIYADYCYEEVAALTGDASICNLINYSGGKTDCKAVVLKDVSYCENSDSEDCYQMLALLTGDEKVCEGLKERNDLEWARDLDREVSKCIKMAKREITGCSEVSGTGIDCDMIPVVTKNPSWCEKLEINRDRCYFYTAMRIADLLPLKLILLRN